MKDFFDLYILASAREFDEELLAKAVRRTFERRKATIPEEPFALTGEFYADRQQQTQWRAFLRKSGVEAPEDFTAVGGLLRPCLLPLLSSGTKKRARRGRRGESGARRCVGRGLVPNGILQKRQHPFRPGEIGMLRHFGAQVVDHLSDHLCIRRLR